ncbi:MAG TPA: L-threonylcarbamoyladenylate synthase [Leptospiraceae bacterium]|nr:L-threonylcarbamoyladenylate synthase [Leptospiraceae bacterium]HMW03653.1 L-threonylcarbamoyladenylate synthase [Leptospiraceae bacterium]HMX31220.1 L-threonylcarbamoyladenylate synthase [Leptospiraceae bacterium]HMY29426.1 L-threonylcarbamoyladenylate synthase [Leptospiraceae bacterium]HMZ65836.1 L-threonylcarbamoyladenylate synthase [Leptospiraceae bacterium]
MQTIVSSDIEKASLVLKNGGVLVFPTETVYGIGADSRNLSACERIYSIKNRPKDNPFIVHVDSIESMGKIAVIPSHFKDAIERLTPGPITFIFEKKDESIFSTGLSTIGVRIPSHPIARKLLEISKTPVSAPSANLSGRPSITRFKDAVSTLINKVDMILEGEDSEIGVESTVVDLTLSRPVLLRPGGISFTHLNQFFPNLQKYQESKEKNAKPASPGMKYRHYAPDAEVVLISPEEKIEMESAAFIGFKEQSVKFQRIVKTNLEYMHHLYSFFIDCDQRGFSRIYCSFPLTDEFEDVLLNRIYKSAMK